MWVRHLSFQIPSPTQRVIYDYDMIISITIRQKPQGTHLKLK